jgi:hypothetical protein
MFEVSRVEPPAKRGQDWPVDGIDLPTATHEQDFGIAVIDHDVVPHLGDRHAVVRTTVHP